MSRQSLSVHLTRAVRYGEREVVLDARASIRFSSDQLLERRSRQVREMLRAQCRDELDEQQRLEDLDRRVGGLELKDRIGRGEDPHARTPPGADR